MLLTKLKPATVDLPLVAALGSEARLIYHMQAEEPPKAQQASEAGRKKPVK
jgi:hypothetical protein